MRGNGRENDLEKLHVTQLVIVEGKYDKIKLSSLLDATILTLDGFRIYKDREKAALIRTLALERGAILLTDSDRAGFQLRGYLKSLLKGAALTQIYIPQRAGKEKRKAEPGAEGLLGVEGIDAATLRKLFLEAGVSVEGAKPPEKQIERMDFYDAGLIGGKNAAQKRQALLQRLGLPGYLTTNALLEIINTRMSHADFLQWSRDEEEQNNNDN